GGEALRVGERGEQQPLVLALAGEHRAERERRGEPRVAVALREPPLHHRVAVAAAQQRDLLLVEILAGEVDHHREQRARAVAQVLAEGAHAEVVARELAFQLELAARGAVEVVVLGGEVEQVARSHGAARTSSWRWRRTPGRAPTASPSRGSRR